MDQQGKISGPGVVDDEATFYRVDENGCGYLWTEKARCNFMLGEDVPQKEL